jgi:chemotaxis signal transduction protein
MSAENESLVPSFVVFQVGSRRVAMPREGVAELIASPPLFSFPHTTPLITGVTLRRGRIVPILDLGPGLLGEQSPDARFFLVVERRDPKFSERCAIPVQGECQLVSGDVIPESEPHEFITGCVNLSGELIEVIDLENAIAASARVEEGASQPAEALP